MRRIARNGGSAWRAVSRASWISRVFGKKRRDAQRALSARLKVLQEEPLRLAEEIGQRFMKSEACLEEMTVASETLVLESESLIELATGQAEGRSTVEETVELLKKPVEYLERWRTEMELHLSELESASRVLGQLSNSEANLQETVRPLVFTGSMFRTESARLPEGSRDVFASLSAEIDCMQAKVRDTFSERFRLVASTQKSIDGVIASVRAESSELKETLLQTTTRIADSVSSLLVEIDKNANRDVNIRRTSQAIAVEVGRIVVELQTHDIVSQRLAHVSTAIGEAGEVLSSAVETGGHGSQESSLKLGHAYASLQVQSAQVVEATRLLHATETTLQDAADIILSRIEVLNNECLLLQEFKEVTAAANGTIQVLLEMISDVRRLTGKAVRIAEDSKRQLDPIGALASRLTGTVEQLSSEMQLIALNAEIQAVHIGAGTGLEVLASHISEVSLTTSQFAGKLSADLEQLSQDLSAIVGSLDSLTANGQDQVTALAGTGAQQEQVLHHRRDAILSKLALVGESGDKIRAVAEPLKEVRGVSAPLETLAVRVADASAEILKIDPNLALTNIEVKAAYSMSAEHEVHNTVMDRLSGKSEMDTSLLSAEVEPEGASRVELF